MGNESLIKYQQEVIEGSEDTLAPIRTDLEKVLSKGTGVEVEPESVEDTIIDNVQCVRVVYLALRGLKNPAIAQAMGISTSKVQKIKASPMYQLSLEEISKEVVSAARSLLVGGALDAVKAIVECLHSPSDRIKLAAAKDMLDRIGAKAPTNIKVENTKRISLDKTTVAELMSLIDPRDFDREEDDE